MLFSKCLRAKIYCNMNGHFDPQGCQTLLLKESELFFLSLGSWTTMVGDICSLTTSSVFTKHLFCQQLNILLIIIVLLVLIDTPAEH